VLCYKSFYGFRYVKAPGLNDRKASCIELIQRALRSFNRESFDVGRNRKNFYNRAPVLCYKFLRTASYVFQKLSFLRKMQGSEQPGEIP
jgi:hypothetical protein